MKQTDIEDAIDSVAAFAKIFVRRAVQETDKAATVVAERFHKSSAATDSQEDDPELWSPTLGTTHIPAGGTESESYRVLAYSRKVGGSVLMRVSFPDGSTGEYPLRNVLSDPLLPPKDEPSSDSQM